MIKINDLLNKIKYKIKMFRNLTYIKNNSKQVLKQLQIQSKQRKLNVVFYVYDSAKWKCQTLYDLFAEDESFEVKILVTRTNVSDTTNPSYQSLDNVKKTYDFFKNSKKNINVELAYDIVNEKYIPFEYFSPDIIIYQHPWYVETSQGPVVCSKFALTYYVPYFVANAGLKEDYYLRFHQYVHKHYLLNQSLVDYFSPKMENQGQNLKAVGHPQLDYFYLNKKNLVENNEKIVIYAPHWTFGGKGLAYGTFEWNGKFLLEYAQSHSHIKWVFKPHPLLKKMLIDSNFMTESEANHYYKSWEKIGLVCDDCEYLDLFSKSSAMITDCGSFLTEYFLTQKPLIRILSGKSPEFSPHCRDITKNYYETDNLEELKNLLDEVIINKNDFMKEKRKYAVENSELCNCYAAKNILDDIKREVLG